MKFPIKPPFHVEADYYGPDNRLYEWAEHWGPPPEGIRTVYAVYDANLRVVSTSNTRARAEVCLRALRREYPHDS